VGVAEKKHSIFSIGGRGSHLCSLHYPTNDDIIGRTASYTEVLPRLFRKSAKKRKNEMKIPTKKSRISFQIEYVTKSIAVVRMASDFKETAVNSAATRSKFSGVNLLSELKSEKNLFLQVKTRKRWKKDHLRMPRRMVSSRSCSVAPPPLRRLRLGGLQGETFAALPLTLLQLPLLSSRLPLSLLGTARLSVFPSKTGTW
jgi:hypothetical protein